MASTIPQKIQTKCLVCNHSTFTPIYSNTLIKCDHCNFITANCEFDQELLAKIYTENYFLGEEYLNYLEDKPHLQKNFHRYLKKIKKHTSLTSTSNILEIGCSYGFFGELIKSKHPHSTYTGIDVVPEACQHAQSLLPTCKIICGDYLNQNFSHKFDVAFMWDVIEHLQHPNKFLRKIHSELNPNATISITTGDISALLPQRQKEKWRMIHPPSHLQYFSAKTLTRLLEKTGFEILNITYPSISRTIKQIFYSLFLLNKKPSKLINKLYKSIPDKSSLTVNTFDIMLITAKKI